MVEGIARHIATLDHRVTILNRVGQSAEQCFSLYDQRLASIEDDYKTLWRQLQNTFSRVKSCMEEQATLFVGADNQLHAKFVGMSDHIGSVDLKLSMDIKKTLKLPKRLLPRKGHHWVGNIPVC